MKPLDMPALTAEQIDAVATLYRTTHNVRLRTRAQMVLLAALQHLVFTRGSTTAAFMAGCYEKMGATFLAMSSMVSSQLGGMVVWPVVRVTQEDPGSCVLVMGKYKRGSTM